MPGRLLCALVALATGLRPTPPRRVSRPAALTRRAAVGGGGALGAVGAAAAPAAAAPAANGEEASRIAASLGSVCCVFATCAEPDLGQPWSLFPEEDATGTGFVVEDADGALKILTNEHVVTHARDVRVRPHGSARRYKARVAFADPERDLALLEVEEAGYWKDGARAAPLRFARDPPGLYATVAVVGYPLGGDNVCVTRGVVSRLDAMAYGAGGGRGEKLLVIQIDAAINSGNSGGPACDGAGDVRDGRVLSKARAPGRPSLDAPVPQVVGVAFCGFAGDADNIGYVIPAAIVATFLADAAAGGGGVCGLGLASQPLTNAALRRSLAMADDATGVLVTRVAAGSAAAGLVAPGDVLTHVDGVAVANDGTVELRRNERIDAAHLVTSRRAGDVCEVAVLRAGAPRRFTVTLAPLAPLVPLFAPPGGRAPTYAILGGLVLMPLTMPLLDALSTEDHLLEAGVDGNLYGPPPPPGDGPAEIVVWSATVTSDANYGYAALAANVPRLTAVNGVAPRSLAHAVGVVRDAYNRGAEFYDLEFVDPGAGDAARVVLDVDAAERDDAELLVRNNLPDLVSPDLERAYYGDAAPETAPRSKRPRRIRKRRKRR